MKRKSWLFAVVAFATAALWAQGANDPYPNFGLPRVESMMFLVLQIGIIIFAAKAGGAIAGMMKMPPILGELAAGIVIGPWALGGIGFGDGLFKAGLFHGAALRDMAEAAVAAGQAAPDATTPELYGIATLASIILLFLSGLETDLKMFLRFSFVGSLVGLGGVLVSFVFGDLCAVYFLPVFFDKFADLSTMPLAQAVTQAAPLYMGIMSTATSVGITARILSEKKKMDSEEGTTIMAGAVIDDVLGLIVLAIGNGIIQANMEARETGAAAVGMEWGKIGVVALKAFGVWLGATAIGILAARWIAKFLKVCFKDKVVIATMAFGLALVLAGFFEFMGLAMIIGAYVMGLALSRTDLKHPINNTLQPVYKFLVPVFFCSMGMMVDMSALCSKPVLYFGLVYTALAISAKVLGCMIPSMCCGFNALGGLRIGAGMVPRGEVALIVAGIGLSGGFLTQEIFGIGILMTLVTTVVAPPALVGLFRPRAKGVRHPKPSNAGSREVSFTLADESVADLMMTKLLEVFRDEGFFVSNLSQEDYIWEVAMDEIEITIRRERNTIVFVCTPPEEAMAMTAWMEVVSQVNDLARSIAKPVRREQIENALAKTEAATGGHEGVSGFLRGFVMLPSFRATSKAEAIRKLVEAVAHDRPESIGDVDSAFAAVMRREESMPTGLDQGIAVPHGRDSSIKGIVGAIAIVDNEGAASGNIIADYETIDKSAVRIIVLTLANSESQTPYLTLMSFISRALRAENGAERLAQCKTADDMRKFFREAK